MTILFGGAETFGNYGKGHHKEQLCEIRFYLDILCRLNVFLIYSSGGHFLLRQSETIKAIFAEGLKRNSSMKLF